MDEAYTRFGLWILPPRSTADELKKIMTIRKDKPHLPTTYPDFEPHITLAAIKSDRSIPLSTILESIPATQRAFPVRFRSVNVGDHYFRSVYASIHLDEALVDLHRTVHEKLNETPNTPKYPHLSLVYVSDEDAANGEKQRYYEELEERRLVARTSGEGVQLRANADGEWIDGFLATEIWVTKCVGPVETWEVLDKIILPQ